jgi:hypothetical protein
MDPRSARAPRANPIVGQYFISPAAGWQGQILSEISNGHFLIQLYVDGVRSTQHAVHVARMADWRLYVTREEWLAAGGAK